MERAEPGDNVRLRIKGIEEEDIRMGFVLCDTDALVQVRVVLIEAILAEILPFRAVLCLMHRLCF